MAEEWFERLQWLANAKPSDPQPDWMGVGSWGSAVSAVCQQAVREIERLRAVSGAVSQGESFGDIKKGITDSGYSRHGES